MIRICTTLQKNGYEVVLIGRKLARSLPLPNYPFQTQRISCIFNKGPWFYAEYNWRLTRLLQRIQPDLIGAVDYDTLRGASAAAKRIGCKLVFDAHEWFEEVPELEGRERVKAYWLNIAKKAMPKTTLRYTVSQGIADVMQQKFNLPFEVIPNYPDLAGREPSTSPRENILVYLGVLNKGRGLEQIIKVMPQIDAKLWLVGEGDIQSELWQLVEKENLLSKVVFKGFVPGEELSELLQKARIGLNLLDSGSLSYKHSLANKFFDYVHAGLPQITMSFPEYTRYNRDHQVAALVDDLKEFTLVYAIKHLLEDRNHWFTLHSNCLRARKEWNWQAAEPKLVSLYTEL